MELNGKVTNPGELRTKITLLRPANGSGTGGFNVPSFTDDATIQARWINVHGSEVWAAEAIQAEQPATVLIRYRSAIGPTWRLRKGSDVFEIVSVDNLRERNEYLELKVRRARNG